MADNPNQISQITPTIQSIIDGVKNDNLDGNQLDLQIDKEKKINTLINERIQNQVVMQGTSTELADHYESVSRIKKRIEDMKQMVDKKREIIAGRTDPLAEETYHKLLSAIRAEEKLMLGHKTNIEKIHSRVSMANAEQSGTTVNVQNNLSTGVPKTAPKFDWEANDDDILDVSIF